MRPLWIVAMWLLAQVALGQGAPLETFRSSSTLVVVPTLVQTAAGEVVTNLRPADFSLSDNGVQQKVSVEEVEHQPVAVLVLLQTGGAATDQFQNYRGLPAMLEYATAGSPHTVAMVTFDSRPEEASDFIANVKDLKDDLTHPAPGDSGAAILDAVNYAIGRLDQQPAGVRRVLLLVSQTHDEGSKTTAEEVVRRLGETNTLICSLTFSPEKTWVKDQFTKQRHENPLYEFSPGMPLLLHTFNLSEPLGVALRAMRANTAAEIAALSGGESLPFSNQAEFDGQLSAIANHLPNSYTLTFRPTSNTPGLHTIAVQVLHQPEPVVVKARETYWLTAPK